VTEGLRKLPLDLGGEVVFRYVEVALDLEADFAVVGSNDDIHAFFVQGLVYFDLAVAKEVTMIIEVIVQRVHKDIVSDVLEETGFFFGVGSAVQEALQYWNNAMSGHYKSSKQRKLWAVSIIFTP